MASALALAFFCLGHTALARTCQDLFVPRPLLPTPAQSNNKATVRPTTAAAPKIASKTAFEDQLNQAAGRFGLARNWKLESNSSRNDINAITGISSHTQIESMPERFRYGPRIYLNHATRKDPIEIAEPIIPTNYPGPDAIGEIASIGERRFRFANIGSRQMHESTRVIDEMIERRYAHSTDVKQVQFPIAAEWQTYHGKIGMLQSTASLMTMENYKARKPYLLNEDLMGLRMEDSFEPARNEYVVVINEIGKPTHEMTLQEFKLNLIAAMRLARSGQGDGISDIDALTSPEPGALPSLSRLSGQPRAMLQKFYAGLEAKGLKVAELTRFSRFQSAPPEVMKSLILRMFEFSEHPTDPVDIFVMEVDAITRRLFAEYGLKELVKLPVEGNEAPEYIMTLDARTPEFATMMAKLRYDVRNLTVAQAPTPKELVVARIATKDYFAQEPTETLTFPKLSSLRASFRRRHREEPPPRSEIKGDLKIEGVAILDQAVGTLGRAREIAKLVAKAKIDASLEAQVDRLTVVERRSLFERVTRYTEDFQRIVFGFTQFLPSQGRILIVNQGVENYAVELKRMFPERNIEIISQAELANQPAASADAIIFNHIFTGLPKSKWRAPFESARRVLKRNRALLTLDQTSRKDLAERRPNGLSLEKLLQRHAASALRNKSPMTETELTFSLILARRFFERSLNSPINGRQLPEAAEKWGYARHVNYGFRESWLIGGELNWMHKE